MEKDEGLSLGDEVGSTNVGQRRHTRLYKTEVRKGIG